MKIKFVVIMSFFFLSLTASNAKTNKIKNKISNTGLQTDISFEDALVNAKHHGIGEAVITVGADKVLDSLLGIKKDFKKRIKKSFYKF
ncbi:MAG: hypothetical protein HAW60_04205 [Bdellovibrionales bacterium]|nr:hypothetical protein [Bdellovibrionales bacterium]